MRYSMMILFDFDYRINNIIDDLKDYDKHCEEREKEELDHHYQLRKFRRKYWKIPRLWKRAFRTFSFPIV